MEFLQSGRLWTTVLLSNHVPATWPVDMIPFGKRPKKLPAVLSGEEVNRLLSCVKCHKHRTFLLLQYAADCV